MKPQTMPSLGCSLRYQERGIPKMENLKNTMCFNIFGEKKHVAYWLCLFLLHRNLGLYHKQKPHQLQCKLGHLELTEMPRFKLFFDLFPFSLFASACLVPIFCSTFSHKLSLPSRPFQGQAARRSMAPTTANKYAKLGLKTSKLPGTATVTLKKSRHEKCKQSCSKLQLQEALPKSLGNQTNRNSSHRASTN